MEEKKGLFKKWLWDNWISHMKKKEVGPHTT